MKISLIRRKWSPTGGAENYLVRLAVKLKQAGHTTHLICDRWSGSAESPFDEMTSLELRSGRKESPSDFAHQVEDLLNQKKYPVSLSLERGIACNVYRAGDGVHRQWMILRKKYRPWAGMFSNVLNRKNQVVCDLEARTFDPKFVRRIIANSLMVKADIQRHFSFPEEKIDHVPNGVDIALFSSGSRERGRQALGVEKDEYVILLVGAGKERKGHRYAREAVRQSGSKARLIIIDHQPPCSMPDAYAAADIFLLPTIYDPFANVTLEAMAAGLPVITTIHNGGAEALGDAGFVLESASDCKQIARYIEELRDPQVRQKMKVSAQKNVQAYTLDRNVDATLAVLQKSEEMG